MNKHNIQNYSSVVFKKLPCYLIGLNRQVNKYYERHFLFQAPHQDFFRVDLVNNFSRKTSLNII